MSNAKVRGLETIYTGVDEYNALAFIIRVLMSEIATAIPVKVIAVEASSEAAGYVDVLPLVTFISGEGKAIQPVTVYHLPYSRAQGGVAALIIDPVVNDIGLAVFAHSDSSNVVAGTTQPQAPATRRKHSQSDGFYIGGFLNQAPSCYLELKQDNTAELRAVNGVHIIGNTTIDGNVTVNGNLAINGQSTMNGGLSATQDITAAGISVSTHIHTGDSGGNTSPPK